MDLPLFREQIQFRADYHWVGPLNLATAKGSVATFWCCFVTALAIGATLCLVTYTRTEAFAGEVGRTPSGSAGGIVTFQVPPRIAMMLRPGANVQMLVDTPIFNTRIRVPAIVESVQRSEDQLIAYRVNATFNSAAQSSKGTVVVLREGIVVRVLTGTESHTILEWLLSRASTQSNSRRGVRG